MPQWKEPAVPRTVVQMIPVDLFGNMLVMHRNENVRSAPNVWSFPSGMHEIGNLLVDEVKRELLEEYDLKALDVALIGVYENIAGDDKAAEQYHWVILLFVAIVEDVTKAVNKEPDKHDKMRTDLPYVYLAETYFLEEHRFHKSFDGYVRKNGDLLVSKIRCVLDYVIEQSEDEQE